MLTRVWVFIFLFYSASVFAEQSLVKEDFAFGNEIVIGELKSVIQVVLPEEVYLIAKNPDLSDIGVFNSRNEVLPHLLMTPETKTIEKTLQPLHLTLFPVHGIKGDPKSFEKLKVYPSNEGAIIEIQNDTQNLSHKIVIGYLIDASKIENHISKIQFFLDGAPENAFINISFGGSDDLKEWDIIEANGVLGNFEINKQKLTKDEVSVNEKKYRYYGLIFRNHAFKVRLKGAKAFFSTSKEKTEESLQWKEVASKKIKEANNQIIYQYDVGGFYPISGIKVRFMDQNSAANLSIETSNNENGPWSAVKTTNFFSVAKEGSTFSNLQTLFEERQSRFWRIRLNSDSSGIGHRFPSVSFGWHFKVIRFLARGEAPFTLAYGSFKVVNGPQTDLFGADWAKDIGTGTLKNKIRLGGTEKLIGVEKTEYPWKKIILWGLLLSGVIFLGSMAFHIKKQIPKDT